MDGAGGAGRGPRASGAGRASGAIRRRPATGSTAPRRYRRPNRRRVSRESAL